jgi:hypothetical protein
MVAVWKGVSGGWGVYRRALCTFRVSIALAFDLDMYDQGVVVKGGLLLDKWGKPVETRRAPDQQKQNLSGRACWVMWQWRYVWFRWAGQGSAFGDRRGGVFGVISFALSRALVLIRCGTSL